MRVFPCVVLVVAVGCGQPKSQNTPPPPVKTTVGAAGGTVSSGDGALSLNIPAGALSADTEITVTEVASPPAEGPFEAAKVYELAPDGLTFASPVTVELKDLSSSTQEGFLLAPVTFVVSNGKAETPDQEVSMDLDSGKFSVKTSLSHFSTLETRWIAPGAYGPSAVPTWLQVKLDPFMPDEPIIGTQYPVGLTIHYARAFDVDASYLDRSGTGLDYGGPEVFPLGRFDAATDSLTKEVGNYTCLSEGPQRYAAVIQGTDYTFAFIEAYSVHRNMAQPEHLGEYLLYVSRTVNCKTPGTQTPVSTLVPGLKSFPSALPSPEGLAVGKANFAGRANAVIPVMVAGNGGSVFFDLISNNALPEHPFPSLSLANGIGALFYQNTTNNLDHVLAFGASNSMLTSWNAQDQAFGFTQLSGGLWDAVTVGGGFMAPAHLTVTSSAFSAGSRFGYVNNLRGAFMPALTGPALSLDMGGAVRVHYDDQGALDGVVEGGQTQSDPRRLRCLLPVCVASNYGSNSISVILWDGTTVPAMNGLTVSHTAVGQGPVGIALHPLSGGVRVATADYNADTVTDLVVSNSGAVSEQKTHNVPSGCTQPGHVAWVEHGGALFLVGTCNGSSNYFVLAAD